MARRKQRSVTVIHVVWYEHWGPGKKKAWYNDKDLEKLAEDSDSSPITTYGILVRESPTHYYVAASVMPADYEGGRHYSGLESIAKSGVRKAVKMKMPAAA